SAGDLNSVIAIDMPVTIFQKVLFYLNELIENCFTLFYRRKWEGVVKLVFLHIQGAPFRNNRPIVSHPRHSDEKGKVVGRGDAFPKGKFSLATPGLVGSCRSGHGRQETKNGDKELQ